MMKMPSMGLGTFRLKGEPLLVEYRRRVQAGLKVVAHQHQPLLYETQTNAARSESL